MYNLKKDMLLIQIFGLWYCVLFYSIGVKIAVWSYERHWHYIGIEYLISRLGLHCSMKIDNYLAKGRTLIRVYEKRYVERCKE